MNSLKSIAADSYGENLHGHPCCKEDFSIRVFLKIQVKEITVFSNQQILNRGLFNYFSAWTEFS
jgi:hypothetical protein